MAPHLPNELWLRVFSNIDDRQTLLAIVVTSHRLRMLGMEQLMHTLVWTTSTEATLDLRLLKCDTDLSRLPHSLLLHPERSFGGDRTSSDLASWPSTIWDTVVSYNFQNLSNLSLSNVHLSRGFYNFLLHARALTHLSLEGCHVDDPPQSLAPPSDAPIAITHLQLGSHLTHHLSAHTPFGPFQPPSLKFIEELPLLRNLTADLWIAISQPRLGQLTSFTSTGRYTEDPDKMCACLVHLLSRGHNLVELCIGPFDPAYPPPRPQGWSAPPFVTALHLQTFVGPAYLAAPILVAAPSLVSLTVTTSFVNTRHAFEIMEHPNAQTLQKLELSLITWDEEVVRGVTHCLPACRELKVLFAFDQPTDDFLFTLGIEDLPRLSQLQTLYVHSFPAPREPFDPYDRRRFYEREPAQAGKPAAVHPNHEDCAEYLAVWTRYNKDLKCVCFQEGRPWNRMSSGRWKVGW